MSHWRDQLVYYVTVECRPVDKLSHLTRLVPLTRLVGSDTIYDDDLVFAAVWLHDLGVFIGHRPEDPIELAKWDHTSYAIRQSPSILTSVGFPADKIDGVLETIRTHQPKDSPTTAEGTILRDADMLEQLGAVSVLRTGSKVGRDTRFVTFDDVEVSLKRQLDQFPALLRLEPSRRLAVPRIEALRRFLEAMRAESRLEV